MLKWMFPNSPKSLTKAEIDEEQLGLLQEAEMDIEELRKLYSAAQPTENSVKVEVESKTIF